MERGFAHSLFSPSQQKPVLKVALTQRESKSLKVDSLTALDCFYRISPSPRILGRLEAGVEGGSGWSAQEQRKEDIARKRATENNVTSFTSLDSFLNSNLDLQ
jgi:hypothetical protein